MLSGCSTLQTHLTTSINHFQDGETIGKGKSKKGLALGVGQLIETEITVEMIENEADYVLIYDVKTEKSKMLVINSFF